MRALLLSEPGDELLLMRLFVPDSGKHIWLTPGGGIELDETPHAALQREVWEETGLRIDHPGDPVWHRCHEFIFRQEHFEQHETYFYCRVAHFAPTMAHNPAQHEAELIDEARWWTLDEINASDEIFVPLKLGHYLAELLHGQLPLTPIDVGV